MNRGCPDTESLEHFPTREETSIISDNGRVSVLVSHLLPECSNLKTIKQQHDHIHNLKTKEDFFFIGIIILLTYVL